MIYLASVFFILFLYLSLRRFELAVAFLIAALPSYLIRFKIFGFPTTILELMILIVFFVWLKNNYAWIKKSLGGRLTKEEKNSKHAYLFQNEIIALIIISFFAVGVADFSNAAFGVWKAYFFEPLLLYIVVLNVLIKKEENNTVNKIILWPLLFSAFAVAILAFYQKITGNLIDNPLWAAAATRRVVSFFGYPNAVGLYLGPLILFFVGWLVNRRIENKKWQINDLFIFVVVFLSLLAIIFAKSVGASLGVFVGLVVFCLMIGKRSFAITISILLFSLISIFSFSYSQDIAIKYLTLNDFSGQVRKIGWVDSWHMLSDGRLITGAGLTGFQGAVSRYHTPGFFYNKDNDPDFRRKIVIFDENYKNKYWQPLEVYLYPHNIFLNFWSELGLFGMLLFAWIIGRFFYLCFKIRKVAKDKFIVIGLLSAVVVIVVHGLVDVPYFKNDLAAIFWIFLAIISYFKIYDFEKFTK